MSERKLGNFPWEDPLASELGRRLEAVAIYLHNILKDFPDPLRHIAVNALSQHGKLFGSATAQGEPLAQSDQSLWSFSVLLTHMVAMGGDIADVTFSGWETIIPVAAAGEILGIATDISDDIQDGDGAFVIEHNTSLAEPLSVFLFALLHRFFDDERILPEWRAFLHGLLTSAIVKAAEAQFLDGWYEQQPTVTPDVALTLTEQKAGPLIGYLYQSGAFIGLAATRPLGEAQTLSEEFAALGTIMGGWHQIDNDDRDANVTTTKSDRQRGKKTLPLVMETIVTQETHDATVGRQAGKDLALIAMAISRRNVEAQLQQIAVKTRCSVQWLQWLVTPAG